MFSLCNSSDGTAETEIQNKITLAKGQIQLISPNYE